MWLGCFSCDFFHYNRLLQCAFCSSQRQSFNTICLSQMIVEPCFFSQCWRVVVLKGLSKTTIGEAMAYQIMLIVIRIQAYCLIFKKNVWAKLENRASLHNRKQQREEYCMLHTEERVPEDRVVYVTCREEGPGESTVYVTCRGVEPWRKHIVCYMQTRGSLDFGVLTPYHVPSAISWHELLIQIIQTTK